MTSWGQKDQRALGPGERKVCLTGPGQSKGPALTLSMSPGPLSKSLATVGVSVLLESPPCTSNDRAEGQNGKWALPPESGTSEPAKAFSDLTLPSRDVPKPHHVQGASLSSVLAHP